VQTSSKKLSQQNERELTLQLSTLLSDLKQPEAIYECLQSLLSETELSVFAKRLAIVERLQRNESYQSIQNELKVSTATISTVSASLSEHPVIFAKIGKLLAWDRSVNSFLSKLLGRV
jgi:uncharacterized protein YerC